VWRPGGPVHRQDGLINGFQQARAKRRWPSSGDPWHAASDLDYGRGDQIGLDFFFNSGVMRGLPAMIPAILYATPEDAANEIAYLYNRKYPISHIEMGEEPDGQRVLLEDYATL